MAGQLIETDGVHCLRQFTRQHVNAPLILVNKDEADPAVLDFRPDARVTDQGSHRDHRRAGRAVEVDTRAGESLRIGDVRLPALDHDRHPLREIARIESVLRLRVGVGIPGDGVVDRHVACLSALHPADGHPGSTMSLGMLPQIPG